MGVRPPGSCASSAERRKQNRGWKSTLFPVDAEAALLLADLRFARSAADARTLELAKRSVRFGAGDDAQALIAKLRAKLDGSARSE